MYSYLQIEYLTDRGEKFLTTIMLCQLVGWLAARPGYHIVRLFTM